MRSPSKIRRDRAAHRTIVLDGLTHDAERELVKPPQIFCQRAQDAMCAMTKGVGSIRDSKRLA
jgi:hypothetical protein